MVRRGGGRSSGDLKMFSKHVTSELSAYCQEELSEARTRAVAEHVMQCVQCRSQLEEIKFGIRLAEQLPQVAAPEAMWNEIQSLVDQQRSASSLLRPRQVFLRPQFVAIAACLLLAILVGASWIWFSRNNAEEPHGPSWSVATLNGKPTIGSATIAKEGKLGVGQWLETDHNSSAEISVASIGQVQVDPNTRIRLVQTQPTEHRLELARGKLSARIWAPPRLFFVDTPSAVAADLGCAYTLEVDDNGGSLLHVTSGWVALQLKDRESMVPAGAACQTRPGVGPGTPYFEDASAEFRDALKELDFGEDSSRKSAGLNVLLRQARRKDTLTLWHLLTRVNLDERRRIYEKMASLAPPPNGVTREGILKLDPAMLDKWKEDMELDWMYSTIPKQLAEAYWKVRNGVTRRISKLDGK